MFPDSFSTPRLDARRLTAADRAEIHRMHRDAAVMTHLGGVRDDLQTDEYMAINLRHWNAHNFGLWIVFEKGGKEPIGRALLRHVLLDGRDDVELGYAFYRTHWGRGFATEIARECVRIAFEELGLDTVVALTSPTNLASQHVLEKAGLRYERSLEHHGMPTMLFRMFRDAYRA